MTCKSYEVKIVYKYHFIRIWPCLFVYIVVYTSFSPILTIVATDTICVYIWLYLRKSLQTAALIQEASV